MSNETGKCDPRRPHDIWLSCFDDYPESERPVFTYRRTSAAEREQITDSLIEPEGLDADALRAWRRKQMREGIYQLLLVGLVGVRNQVNLETGEPVAEVKGWEDMRLLLDFPDADELLMKRLAGGVMTTAEKKGSVSPNCDGTASCAKSAS
jgi:hypothetical protein